MRARDSHQYDRFVRVQGFVADHTETFQATALGRKMLAVIVAAIAALSRYFTSDVSGHGVLRGGSNTRAEVRAALRLNVKAISRTARFLGRETAGVDGRFRLSRHGSDQGLVATARAFLQEAQPQADAFVANGLAENVLKDLPAQIQALEQAIAEQTAGRKSAVEAQASIRAAVRSGMSAVDALDSIVRSRLRDDPVTLALWKNARRFTPRAKSEPGSVPPTPAPSQPSSSETKAA